MKVSVSFLASKKPSKDIKKIGATDVNYIHVDFMDRTFTEKKSLSFKKIIKILKITNKRADIHLMTMKPKKYIKDFATLNAEYITFPVEIKKDIDKCLEMIKSYGIKCGLAISPETDVEELSPYIKDLDMVLVMGVTPGAGGQSFKEEVLEKIKKIRQEINIYGLSTVISVDGGINDEISKRLEEVDIVVSGTYILNSDNLQEAITKLR
ncbi:MAG: ribulose-phosphate 3-epimerase [Bacilli bacterium]|nr:ribulose-phosphate 3-epimerase [Bacilli bacterium]